MAGVFKYENDNQNNQITAITTKQATDHRQIIILETEWRDLKRFSENIIIEQQKTDWFSIMIGAAASTMIPFLHGAFAEEKNANEIIFYAIITIVFLILSIAIHLKNRNKSDVMTKSKVQHDNLCLKIDEIENRVNSEPLGDI